MRKYIVAVLLLSIGFCYAQTGTGKYSIKNLGNCASKIVQYIDHINKNS